MSTGEAPVGRCQEVKRWSHCPLCLCQGECQLPELAQQGRGRKPKFKTQSQGPLPPLNCPVWTTQLNCWTGIQSEQLLCLLLASTWETSKWKPVVQIESDVSPRVIEVGGGRQKESSAFSFSFCPHVSPVLLGRGSLIETLHVQDYILWVYRNRKCWNVRHHPKKRSCNGLRRELREVLPA